VDTRLTNKKEGGQYAVLVSDTEGLIGRYQYLLFDIFSTDTNSPFGNTFFSEIDVIDRDAPPGTEPPPAPVITETFETDDGKHQVIINTSDAPDLTEWARRELAPVMKEWYPKIIALLPSDGYVAPERVTLTFVEGMNPGIPAAAGGKRISCNVEWFRKNLKGITPDGMKLLLNYPWPGNVRELKNAIERAMILEDHGVIDPAVLIDDVGGYLGETPFAVVEFRAIEKIMGDRLAHLVDAGGEGNSSQPDRQVIVNAACFDRNAAIPWQEDRHILAD
jgi:hypothetical protein